MLCLFGCKPEPADSTGSDSSSPTSDPGKPAKEPTVDTTTLEGWYVGTFNCAGQKLNYDTFKIDGNKMSYYWFHFSVSNGEVSLDLQEDLDCEIAVDGLKFNDYVNGEIPEGDNWEMYTDSKGTCTRNTPWPATVKAE